MNIDELKLILETLQHTTDGAKDFGIWWLALHYGAKVFEAMLVASCILGVAWGIYKAVIILSGASEDTHRLQYLRNLMRVGSPGRVTDGEFDQMRGKVRNWMEGESK